MPRSTLSSATISMLSDARPNTPSAEMCWSPLTSLKSITPIPLGPYVMTGSCPCSVCHVRSCVSNRSRWSRISLSSGRNSREPAAASVRCGCAAVMSNATRRPPYSVWALTSFTCRPGMSTNVAVVSAVTVVCVQSRSGILAENFDATVRAAYSWYLTPSAVRVPFATNCRPLPPTTASTVAMPVNGHFTTSPIVSRCDVLA